MPLHRIHQDPARRLDFTELRQHVGKRRRSQQVVRIPRQRLAQVANRVQRFAFGLTGLADPDLSVFLAGVLLLQLWR